jgi:RND family efflux transporter MFP subunit
MKSNAYLTLSACALALLALMALSACSGKSDASNTTAAPVTSVSAPTTAPAATASAPMAPVSVTTIKAQKRDLPVSFKATGTVTPLNSVDIKAQVSSPVIKVHIQDGQFVRAGDLLITLDARNDEANMAKARAQMAKDSAGLADAQRQLIRAKQLLAQNFVSQGAIDSAQALVDAASATVAADQAAMDATKVALSNAHITAPLSGRAGAVHVSAGSSVQANVTPLVTITQLDPVGVVFSLPQRNLPDALAALKGNAGVVTATLPDGAGDFKGRLRFVDNNVDAASGAIKVKADFANRDNKLWPGAFVDVALTVSTIKDAIVIPQTAIVQTARGSVVYLVEDGKAELRPVQLLSIQGNDAAITGIKAGDVVVLDGKQNLRPGTPVMDKGKEAKVAGSKP